MNSLSMKSLQLQQCTPQPSKRHVSHKAFPRMLISARLSQSTIAALNGVVGAHRLGVSTNIHTSTVCKATAAAEAGPSALVASHVDDSRQFAVAMAKIADDTKATDLAVLHVEPLVSWCSYMVVCTVMSRPQLLAVLGRMEDAAQQDWDRQKQNSAGSSQWEVLDFGDVVVHVFTAEQREHYDLDSFYAAAEEVPLPFLEDWSGSSSSQSTEQQSSSSAGRTGPAWTKNL